MPLPRARLLAVLASVLSAALAALADGGPAAALSLADDLVADGAPAQAALEYRRLAADSGDPAFRGACYLLAADAYRAVPAPSRMNLMLDHAEEEGAIDSPAGLWLRIQSAELGRDWASAALYAADLASGAGDDGRLARYARRTSAADFLRAGAANDARAALEGDPNAEALERYLAGRDKSPTLGGILGIVPGLGYAYSGEYGNALRSLLLNGLFGWAMFATAEDDQWALFAVATFFELTWYSGSIYGGVDAAHRRNRDRLDSAVREIRGDDAPRLDHQLALPLLKVGLSF